MNINSDKVYITKWHEQIWFLVNKVGVTLRDRIFMYYFCSNKSTKTNKEVAGVLRDYFNYVDCDV